ncbi:MAG: chorismate synthase [Clostridiales bacterium]|jgi:chorismate synthase|nr:chorismate synthase [Clostridiales bacterium]
MGGSSFGTVFKVTTWGESHGRAVGAVIDGCPAGLFLDMDFIRDYMERRAPGGGKYATPRKERDIVEIYSGIFDGMTTGCSIQMVVANNNQDSGAYSEIRDKFRPGHADYGYFKKYGIRDYRGGGRSSGRETAARVAAGAVAALILKELGVELVSYVRSIGGIEIPPPNYGVISNADARLNELNMPDDVAYRAASAYLSGLMEKKDSAGGVVECVARGLKAGLGDPVFDKLDAALARAVFSIGAVKAVEIGAGTAAAKTTGSKNNDQFFARDAGGAGKRSNHAGGITGGISDGAPIIVRASFKPTPSIARPQETVNTSFNNVTIAVEGRHDTVIAPRAVVVVEAMVAIVLLDAVLKGVTSKMDNLRKAYANL